MVILRKICVTSALLVCLLSFTSMSLAAAKATIRLEPIKNLAGEAESGAATQLAGELLAAVSSSANFIAISAGSGEAADYALSVTVTKVSDYEAKEAREQIKVPSRQSNDKKGNEVSPQAPQKGSNTGLKGKELAADVRLVSAEGKTIFNQTFIGNKEGTTAKEALDNTCKEMTRQILAAMEKKIPGDIKPKKAVAPVSSEKTVQGTTVPAAPTAPAVVAPFRAIVGDMAGDTLYLDKGQGSGIRLGEELTICHASGDVVIGGKVVGKKEIPIGKAKVIEIYAVYSVCQVLKKNQAVAVGDIAKRL